MRIFVRCLASVVTENDLHDVFETFGDVADAEFLTLRPGTKPSLVGYVEMPDFDEAVAAIDCLDDLTIGGLPISLDELRHGTGRRVGVDRREDSRPAAEERRTAFRRAHARLAA